MMDRFLNLNYFDRSSLTIIFQLRWAYDENSNVSELEKSLLPRDTPSLVYLRIALLAIISWILVLSSLFGGFLGTISLGRFIGESVLLAFPDSLSVTSHDPISLVIGVIALISLYRMYRRFKLVLRQGNIIMSQIPLRGFALSKLLDLLLF